MSLEIVGIVDAIICDLVVCGFGHGLSPLVARGSRLLLASWLSAYRLLSLQTSLRSTHAQCYRGQHNPSEGILPARQGTVHTLLDIRLWYR